MIFIVTITFLVLIHEGGHFIAAKLAGIWVHRFAIGFGPPLLRFKGKETEYSIRLFPIGGYVHMAGEEGGEISISISNVPPKRLFGAKPPWVRMAVVLSGPVLNIIAAALIIIVTVGWFGVPYLEVAGIIEGSPASYSLKIGDKIVEVEGKDIYSIEQLQRIIQSKGSKPLSFEVLRGSKIKVFSVQPKWYPEEGRYLIGVFFSPISTTNVIERISKDSFLAGQGLQAGDSILSVGDVKITSWFALINEVEKTLKGDGTLELIILRGGRELRKEIPLKGNLEEVLGGVQPKLITRRPGLGQSFVIGLGRIWNVANAIYATIKGIFKGAVDPGEAFSGPVGIADVLGQGFRAGVMPFLTIVALISLSLGFINLIPFPALDGSRIVFILYEMIRGKPIPPEKEGWVHYIGFIILIVLILLITYNDIMRLLRP